MKTLRGHDRRIRQGRTCAQEVKAIKKRQPRGVLESKDAYDKRIEALVAAVKLKYRQGPDSAEAQPEVISRETVLIAALTAEFDALDKLRAYPAVQLRRTLSAMPWPPREPCALLLLAGKKGGDAAALLRVGVHSALWRLRPRDIRLNTSPCSAWPSMFAARSEDRRASST